MSATGVKHRKKGKAAQERSLGDAQATNPPPPSLVVAAAAKRKQTVKLWVLMFCISVVGLVLIASSIFTTPASDLARTISAEVRTFFESLSTANSPTLESDVTKKDKRSRKKKKTKTHLNDQEITEDAPIDPKLIEAAFEAKRQSHMNKTLPVEKVEHLQITPILRCSASYGTPTVGRRQRCCEFKPGKLTCLPNLVVMGVQKGGTTAVHSYLLLHPQLIAARKKELHLFDFDKNFVELKNRINLLLPNMEPSLVTQRITIDSTPSYLADHKSCPRMSRVLSKDARFVVLLREPTERVWSELHMKNRRVIFQNEFLFEIMPKYYREFKTCLAKCAEPCQFEGFKRCLPEEIRSHGRVATFIRFINDADKKDKVKILKTTCLESEQSVIDCHKEGGALADEIMKEKMPPIPEEVEGEIRNLTRTMSRCCLSNTTAYLKRQNAFRGIQFDDDYTNPSTTNFDEDGDEFGFCDGCGCRCFPRATMISDIAKFHVWRSLYFPQILHCYMNIAPSRFLFIDMNELREDAQSVMSKIFAHSGIKDLNISEYSLEQVQAMFRRLYPDFENVSGWAENPRLDSMPKLIPASLKATLDDFFRPYNRKLFDLLGVEPFKGWAV